jgi:anti-sigma B factor antagonist
MPIESKLESGNAVVSVSGRLVAGREVERLETLVTEQLALNQKRFVLDMTGLEYTDSSGIGTIVSCLTKVKKAGGDIRLAGVNARIARMFKMTGVDSLMTMYPTLAEALAG